MKKIVVAFIIMSLVLSFIPTVKAETFTLNEIVTKFENTSLQGDLAPFEEIKLQATIESSENSFSILSNVEGLEIKTIFYYENGWITYQYDGDKSSENMTEIVYKLLIESVWIEHLTYVIGLMHGYDYNEINNFFESQEKCDFLEFTYFNYGYQNEEGNIDIGGQGIDTFKVNVNNFNLNNVQDENIEQEQNENNEQNNVENPQTGFKNWNYIFIIIAGVLITILIRTRKNAIKKI